MMEWFSSDYRKTNQFKETTPTNHNRRKQFNAMNQSEFLTTTCNLRKARDSKIARVGLVLLVVLLLIG